MKTELQKRNERTLSTGDVKSRMVTVREQLTLLDRDVAELYGVKTREVNQAVRNNPEKFPEGYVFRLNDAEFSDWRSKILTSDLPQETKDSRTGRAENARGVRRFRNGGGVHHSLRTRVGAFLAASTGILTGDLSRIVRDGSPRVFHHFQT